MASKLNAGKMRPRSSRASGQQIEFLINYMLTHKHFATGRLLAAQGRHRNQEQWKRLCSQLNDLPGPRKLLAEWKKCWTDYRGNVRNRAAKAKGARERTGNTLAPSDLSDLDLKVLSILGTDSFLILPFEEAGLEKPQDEVENTRVLGIMGCSKPIPQTSEVDEQPTYSCPSHILELLPSTSTIAVTIPQTSSTTSSPFTSNLLSLSAPHHIDPLPSPSTYVLTLGQTNESSQPLSSPFCVTVPIVSPSLLHTSTSNLPPSQLESTSSISPTAAEPSHSLSIPPQNPTLGEQSLGTSTSTSPATGLTKAAAQSASNSTAFQASLQALKDIRAEDSRMLKDITDDVHGMREAMERIARAVERLVDGQLAK